MKKTPVEKHFDKIAIDYDFYKSKNKFYYDNLKKLLKDLIQEGKTVLEIGCGTGDILASLNPKAGYGYDISSEMIDLAKRKHEGNKNLHFSNLLPNNSPDFILMSDVIEHLENPTDLFKKISGLMGKKSAFICTMANPIWEPVLLVGEWLGLKMPEGPHKRIGYMKIWKIMKSQGMGIIKHDYKLLIPVRIPFVTEFANRDLERYLKRFAFIEYFVASKS